ncbi:YegP family protein [Suttonella sp. R2A3]|uniref:YegP family protein n=1 Tax=Suttonella sp. R2A3 TaxID=2908648 RepID=UPI001F3824C8|nr:YegP family protein [Suttonella sp. R2A3]UJF24046.1 YegP family protein [Suttonella sp. R2A3]
MSLTFELKTSKDNQFYFNLVENGKVLVKSEMYTQKRSCENGIESVQKNCGEDKRYEHKTASNGKKYFNLKASNGQVIATSMMFDDIDAVVKSCKKAAKAKTVEA